MDDIQKFLGKIDRKLKEQVLKALRAIRTGQGVENLDVTALKGKSGWYRCRVRSVRIIFYKHSSGRYIVHKVRFQDEFYRD